jgi:ABC-2 type transport system ATP-binding protein
MKAVEVNDLRRVYLARMGLMGRKVKEVIAVDGISFSVNRGELFGLLGPNGAGKTTTIKMLTTLLIPTSGTASVLGFDLIKQANKIRPVIGFIYGGERGLYWRLNAFDNLRYFANLYHIDPDHAAKRIPELLELVGLGGRGDERIEGFSRGMKQRLHIARALLHDPEVLFLDEPTLGLDPVGAREMRDTIRDLQAEGKTIFLTTHYMFEAEALCERIAVIDKGKVVALDSPTGLKKHVQDLSVVEVEVFGIRQEALDIIRSLKGVETASIESVDQKQTLHVQSPQGSESVAPVLRVLEERKLRTGRITVREPTLEDAYVRLVGGDA